MKNQNELQLEKMLEVLRGFGLSSDLVDTAEKYLSEGKKELLRGFPKQDLSKIKKEEQEASRQMFSGLLKRNRMEEALRLFHIVFQIGGSTSSYVFPILEIRYNFIENEFIKQIEAYQAVTLYAEGIAYEVYQLRRLTVENILKLAGNRKEVLVEAIDKWQSQYDNGKMVVYTAYFSLLKKEEPKSEEKKGILKGLADALLGKGSGYVYAPETGKYVQDFEKSVLASSGSLLSVGEAEMKEILDYIAADKDGSRSLSENAALLFQKHPMDKYLLKLLAGGINIHYDLSRRLQSFLKLCAFGNTEDTLNAVYEFMDKENGEYWNGKLKADLKLETVPYIIWCGGKKIKAALYYEIENDFEAYGKAVEQAPLEVQAELLEAIKIRYPKQYEKLSSGSESELQRKIAESILPQGNARAAVKGFLMENEAVESLYAYAKELQNQRSYYSRVGKTIEQYRKAKGCDSFYKRCMTYLSFTEMGYFFFQGFTADEGEGYRQKEIAELFQIWEETGLGVLYQLNAAEVIYEGIYTENKTASFLEHVVSVFTKYLELKEEETLKAFEMAGSTGRFIGICTLGANGKRYKDNLMKAFSDTSKLVTDRLVEIVAAHEEWEEEVLGKLKSKKSAEREAALLVLTRWEKDYKTVLEEALAAEKSKKLQDMLKSLLSLEGNIRETGPATAEAYIKEVHKGGRKKGIQWAYETPFTAVHMEEGTEVAEEYMQAILLAYYCLAVPGVNKEVLILTEPLNKKELALYVNELFDKWMEAGAEAKKKWVLYAAAIHGGSEIVYKLQHNINQWPVNARGAIAAEAVKALALNDTPSALLVVDSISRKFKFKQIKTAAMEALDFAAQQLGLTTEELADRIVPDLGFNEEMQRIFDYGERRFFVYITPALEIEIRDENDKKLKNIPSPGKKDDEAKAQAALEEFKLLKKQMKAAVANQKLRLDLALSVERKWDIAGWKNLFVKNPIMHQFAIGLIWGYYQEDKLLNTFRYMEDGSFNTEDEEEFLLPEEGKIGLVHPIELRAENIEKWKEQLSDYEVEQPIEQLTRKVFPLTEEEKEKKSLERFGGMILNPMSLSGKLLGMGWYRGSVQDAGGYYTFYREDSLLSLGVELHFSGSFVGYETEDVTVYAARFYDAGTIKRGSYEYDEVTEEKAIALNQVPARYFSEIVYQLEKATVSSQERDENWRQKA
ncbi:DUF4132 domain-containing protein [Anaerocolumna xylanovorans]|uniref:DUF4132 domain-containing protein n=1 Tax=Anaerocolumna xylanovorans DSM 12503 TaxID=1121345 RepID=A0A1M7XYG2_9FIRM|nr:DUF4132 domain-containing protein [Anaerocolumna xylanovorans]SHO44086.1 protein of unknown function [Anaerocolumna xylanovorans DSM 12503]